MELDHVAQVNGEQLTTFLVLTGHIIDRRVEPATSSNESRSCKGIAKQHLTSDL